MGGTGNGECGKRGGMCGAGNRGGSGGNVGLAGAYGNGGGDAGGGDGIPVVQLASTRAWLQRRFVRT